MKKIISFVALSITLAGCSPSGTQSVDHNQVMENIPELKGCKTFKVSDGYKDLWIVRCPASETVSVTEIHNCGKNCTTTQYTATVMDSLSPNGGDPIR